METNKEEYKKLLNERDICRAAISASDGGEYDFYAMAVPTNNKQLRYSSSNDELFYQVLRTGKENIVTSRLDSGLPIFDNHTWNNGALNQLGISVGYEFTEQGIVTRNKWGARADEALRSDVKNKIVKTVSIEGTVHTYSIERKVGEIPIYYAELWEPESLSFAPVPQDIEAQIGVQRALKEQIKSEVNPHNGDTILTNIINKFTK